MDLKFLVGIQPRSQDFVRGGAVAFLEGRYAKNKTAGATDGAGAKVLCWGCK